MHVVKSTGYEMAIMLINSYSIFFSCFFLTLILLSSEFLIHISSDLLLYMLGTSDAMELALAASKNYYVNFNESSNEVMI